MALMESFITFSVTGQPYHFVLWKQTEIVLYISCIVNECCSNDEQTIVRELFKNVNGVYITSMVVKFLSISIYLLFQICVIIDL